MKLDLSKLVLDLKDQPLPKDGGADVTFGHIAVQALLADLRTDTPDSKVPRFKLAVRLAAATGEVEISVDEAKLLLERVRHVCVTIVAGRFDEALNGGT